MTGNAEVVSRAHTIKPSTEMVTTRGAAAALQPMVSHRFSTSTARPGPSPRFVGVGAGLRTVGRALGGRKATHHQPGVRRVLRCSAAGDSAVSDGDSEQGSKDKTAGSLEAALAGLDKMLGVEEEVEMVQEEDENPTITVPLLWRGGGGGGSSVAASLDPTSATGVITAAEYCGLTLKFPQRATPSQKERGVAGVELDFVLDTACSADFVLPQVAMGLDVEVVGETPGGVAATGAIAGGPLVMFGDVELGGVNVIQGFSATALMLPTAGLAGILGKRFFDCFDAVSLDWSQRPGTATFHQDFEWESAEATAMACVPLQLLQNGLLRAEVSTSAGDLPALLDTGAPVSIINTAAARLLGVEPEEKPVEQKKGLGGLLQKLTPGGAAAAPGTVMVAGAGGKPIRLTLAASPVALSLSGVALLAAPLLVGDLPVFTDGLELTENQPGLVLGLDLLTQRPKVVLSTKQSKMLV